MSTHIPPLDQKQQLREIRRLCRLGALAPDQLGRYFVETEQARDPHANLRERIKEALEDDEDIHLLVFGHGGSGKSTELVKLTQELGDQFFTVNFSILDDLDILSVTAADILVIVTEQVVKKASQNSLGLDDDLLKPIYDWFAQETVTQSDGTQSQLGASAEVGVGSSVLAPFVKLMATLRSDIKFSTDRTKSRVWKISQRPSELANQVNALLETVRNAIPNGQRLLIIVEDADKLDIRTAKEVFIDDANLLTSLNADIVYTIPLFTYYSPDAQVLRTRFSQCFSLPMIKVADSQGNRCDDGFNTVKEVIRKRISVAQLDEAAVEILIQKTGGVLQHVFEVINIAAFMTDATVPLEAQHIEYGLQRKKREMQGDITIPIGGIPGEENAKVSELFDRLAEHARKQMQGQEILLENDPINQVLLKTCALVEYNGKGWHGVHPLVKEILSDLYLI